VGDVEALRGHGLEHRLRRRRGGGDENSTAAAAPRFSALRGVEQHAITIGAPHRCVTLWSAIASKIALASTRRRQTWVPATAVMVHGKHQPLQWNIGSVHR
jgi:hypothetical protein